MFGKKEIVTLDRIDTIIGKDTTFNGSITGKGAIRLDGTIEGDMIRHGDVIVGETGLIRANISARHVTVAGIVEGNISAEGKIELIGSGKIFGNIEAENLVINEGSIFRGTCTMRDPKLDDVHPKANELIESEN
jgi:cytoskeletal protein CcmA (bactofilin family)